MMDATVPSRFGFRGSSISQLPTSTTSLASIKTKTSTLHPTDVDDSTSDTTMNGVPIDIDVRVLEKFEETFGEETVEVIEQLLEFRYKTKKFEVKCRKDEEFNYTRKLKTVVGDFFRKVKQADCRRFLNDLAHVCVIDRFGSSATFLRRWMAKLQQQRRNWGGDWQCLRTKYRLEAERRQLKGELDTMQKSMNQICASELEAISSNKVLEDNEAELELQIEETKRLNEQMKVTLKAYEARMVEESRRSKAEKRGAAREVAELKDRLQHTDEEVSNLLKSFIHIHKVNASELEDRS
ncbi:hypothetical protein PsorP6_001409 [Peronosclerospora sorghi]|uniref:Uncharacterized protein n=1 Tax=Peronosclerospora sorghi TaxID=230839 RepID=A0ACC0WW99_9STRA|nr:hypothetical protein PsorP6_001409 [Peronosclerospora sorghi]